MNSSYWVIYKGFYRNFPFLTPEKGNCRLNPVAAKISECCKISIIISIMGT